MIRDAECLLNQLPVWFTLCLLAHVNKYPLTINLIREM
jgi:hypothetical protein